MTPYETLKALRERIASLPRHQFDYSWWLTFVDPDDPYESAHHAPPKDVQCDTIACVAGHLAVMLWGVDEASEYFSRSTPIHRVAVTFAPRLGITDAEAVALFANCPSLVPDYIANDCGLEALTPTVRAVLDARKEVRDRLEGDDGLIPVDADRTPEALAALDVLIERYAP